METIGAVHACRRQTTMDADITIAFPRLDVHFDAPGGDSPGRAMQIA